MEAPTFRRSSFCPPPVSESWSAEEVAATVADYMTMLEQELRGEPVNKAEHNRLLRSSLRGRSKGAVEFKHANISALMIELGLPYIDGYQPRGNYQALLRDEIVTQWDAKPVLQACAGQAATAGAPKAASIQSIEAVFVPVPVDPYDRSRVREQPTRSIPPRRGVNYLEVEARNAALGLAGELFVMELEHKRLWTAGERGLAGRVEHVSQTQGDGLGYDIVSFDSDGRELLIEVKTTSFGAMTPFFATRREVAVSQARENEYRLYRLHKFRSTPRVFVLPGQLDKSCLLDPVLYSARLA